MMRSTLPVRVLVLLAVLALNACASNQPRAVIPEPPKAATPTGRVELGVASWHGPSPRSGQSRTASGKRWSNSELIAAHKTLRLGTFVRVTHLGNKKEVVVQIIDRGPYIKGRVVDLSPRAAEAIGIKKSGVGKVRVEVVRL